ncbi:unnamed protein product [Kuraishia capsulata CBS 1993]|uniref:Zn(2)-C6 fungal-type domain-containing protein n=1 Tax=Kuraishia capsulata CBS 1993 TaxID=1382522 RepID=W6MTH0_9ASCO|nr:uncharacterized protein KUCA_T00006014001 [Kuraishia capsulata CBS 1993]CDK30019.1 unnamed protein product [Kuraishia capsulata CBS 1993]
MSALLEHETADKKRFAQLDLNGIPSKKPRPQGTPDWSSCYDHRNSAVVIKTPEIPLESELGKNDQPKPRRLKSCTRCRKHKVKCDFIQTEPNPCTCCVKKGVVCELEVIIPVRRSNLIKDMRTCVLELKMKVAELVKADKSLREMCTRKGLVIEGVVDVGSLEHAPEYSEYEEEEEELEEYDNAKLNAPQPTKAHIAAQIHQHPEQEVFVAETSGKRLQFSCSEILLLVDWFNVNILPLVPIMNPITSPTLVLKKSPLLFWSIVCISSVSMRRLTVDQLAALSVHINTALVQATWMSTPKSVTIVQAILLLSAFPVFCIPLDDDLEDPCFRWLELAKNICLQTGVNRGSQFVNEFSRRKDISPLNGEDFDNHGHHLTDEQIRDRIWAYVFILGNECGDRLGLPWDQRPDSLIDKLRVGDTSKQTTFFQTALETQIVHSKITEQLGKSFRSPSGLIQNAHGLSTALSMWHYLLHSHKEKVMGRFVGSDVERKMAEIRIYECKLHLCLFGGTLDGVNEDDELNDISVRKALEVALNIENEITSLGRGYCLMPIGIRHAAELASLVLLRLLYFPFVVQDPHLQTSVSDSVRRFYRFFRAAMSDQLTAALNPSLRRTLKLMREVDNAVLRNPRVFWKNTRLLKSTHGHLSMNVFYEIESIVDPCAEQFRDEQDDQSFFQRLGIKGKGLIERIKNPQPLHLSEEERQDEDEDEDEEVTPKLHEETNEGQLNETIDDLVNLVGKSQEEDISALNKLLKQID